MADKAPNLTGQMPSSFDSSPDFYSERAMHKVVRKIKEEPLIPLGIGLTVAAFVNAYRALRRGDSKQANRMFRARVLAQGFTIVAMVAGSMYYSQDRAKTKELRQLQEQQDAEQKRHQWIRELEARDEEEKAMKSLVQKKAAAAVAAAAESKPDGEDVSGENAGTGGILGKMGLWSQGEKKAAEEAAASGDNAEGEEGSEGRKTKRENPKSSLGTIGELMANHKKDGPKGESNK